jgi:hypothetical protein
VKTKLRGIVEVVPDDNNELTVGDDIFQLGELVDPYRVAPSNDLEKNSKFCIAENIFVDIDVDADELNVVLSSNAHTKVDEDNNDKINVEDCDRDKDESIDEEEDNSD